MRDTQAVLVATICEWCPTDTCRATAPYAALPWVNGLAAHLHTLGYTIPATGTPTLGAGGVRDLARRIAVWDGGAHTQVYGPWVESLTDYLRRAGVRAPQTTTKPLAHQGGHCVH